MQDEKLCFCIAQRKNEVVYAGFDVATNTPLAGKKKLSTLKIV